MLQINLPQLPNIETNRLLLREQRLSDAQALYQLRTNTDVMRYIDRPRPKIVQDAEAIIQNINEKFETGMNLIWAITLKERPDQMIGNLGYWRTDLPNYRAEIGYMLHPDYWKQGILSEALAAIIDFGFQVVGFHSVCANINPENEASRKLLLKHGFIKEAYFREDYYFDGKFLDSEIYGLLNNIKAETPYTPVAWEYKEVIQEQLDKGTSGKVFFFGKGAAICEGKGQVLEMNEIKNEGLFIFLDTAVRIRVDRIITLFGKPGAAYDEYEAYANTCSDCKD